MKKLFYYILFFILPITSITQTISVINPFGTFGNGTGGGGGGGGGSGGPCNWNTAGYTLKFFTGLDQLSDMLYEGNGQYGNGTISTTVFHQAPGSFYSRPQNVSSGIRSEIQYTNALQNAEEGVIEYYAFYEVVIPDNGHSLQWHPNTDGGSASPGLWHIGGKFVMVNWLGGGNTERPTGMTIQTNHWYNIRCEYKFGSAGYFRLYIDCVLQTGASWTGQVGDNSGHYLKLGYNGWDANSTSSRIYYDQLSCWSKP